MTRGTKEFYDLQNQFEKDVENIPVYTGAKIERNKEQSATSHYFYDNGKLNDLFLGYMAGYQLAKCMAMQGEFNL